MLNYLHGTTRCRVSLAEEEGYKRNAKGQLDEASYPQPSGWVERSLCLERGGGRRGGCSWTEMPGGGGGGVIASGGSQRSMGS